MGRIRFKGLTLAQETAARGGSRFMLPHSIFVNCISIALVIRAVSSAEGDEGVGDGEGVSGRGKPPVVRGKAKMELALPCGSVSWKSELVS